MANPILLKSIKITIPPREYFIYLIRACRDRIYIEAFDNCAQQAITQWAMGDLILVVSASLKMT